MRAGPWTTALLAAALCGGWAAPGRAADVPVADRLRLAHAGSATLHSDLDVAALYPKVLDAAALCYAGRAPATGMQTGSVSVIVPSVFGRVVQGGMTAPDRASVRVDVDGLWTKPLIQVDLSALPPGAAAAGAVAAPRTRVDVYYAMRVAMQENSVGNVERWLAGDWSACVLDPVQQRMRDRERRRALDARARAGGDAP